MRTIDSNGGLSAAVVAAKQKFMNVIDKPRYESRNGNTRELGTRCT